MKIYTRLKLISSEKLVFIMLTTAVLFGFIIIQHILNPNFYVIEFVRQPYSSNQHNLYFMSSRRNRSRSKYLVYTDNCRLQDLNPFDPKQMTHFDTSAKKPNCSSSQPPMELVGNQLRFKGEILNLSGISPSWKIPTCCFSELIRVEQYDQNADWTTLSSECHLIDDYAEGTTITAEFIEVKCNSFSGILDETTTVSYFAQVFPLEQQSFLAKEKKKYWDRYFSGYLDLISESQDPYNNDLQTNSNHTFQNITENSNVRVAIMRRPPSVLLIGIDATSRLHSIRSIPQTRAFLKNNDFIEMEGYTKTGDHTFTNIMGSLAGMEVEQTKYDCYPNVTASTDNCPFIWKQYSENNYVTAYLEDYLEISIFGKAGLRKQPTDYYPRTILLPYALGDKYKKPHRCMSGMTEANFLFDYSKNFIKKMARGVHRNETYPYFLFSWMSSISHDDFNGFQLADQDLLNYFSDLLSDDFEGKPNDNTIMVFLSDHGRRFGTGRDNVSGYYETSLPMFFIRIPPSLKLAKPQWSINLMKNSQVLTTPLDLHKTLQHILSLSSLNPETYSNSLETDNSSYSLFTEIPQDRSCESSRIHSTYCRCNIESAEEDLNVEMLAPSYGEAIAQWVNDLLKQRGIFHRCLPLRFEKYAYARQLYFYTKNLQTNGRNYNVENLDYKYFMIAALTQPGNGLFEGTIKISGEESGPIEFIGNVSRITSFGQYYGQNECMPNPDDKLYCTCQEQ